MMGKIIQIETCWNHDKNMLSTKPMLIALDDTGRVWVWDWLDKRWMALGTEDDE